ncbi:hypothetical protein L1S35_07975 [Flavobacterium sp. AS60]|uniref:hypothetical protein n=1 Tax=Flavobacterium anseongense TaxID=2910677 RepID=UPI001F36DFE6|nr:hypothetical protein [Flavobacterium sp. AS60]MCF6129606.1 hypothetical protein [Flavobacterium sp. AS60]
MKTIDKKNMLKERITALEIQQTEELRILKLEFHSLAEKLNPLYLIKNTFKNLTADPEIKSNLLDSAISMTSQFIAGNTFLNRFQTPIKNIIGNVFKTILNKISPTSPRIS